MVPAGVAMLGFSRRMRAIRADNGAQLRLLDLQTVDTKLAQLGHRRQTLPEHAVIAKLQTRRSALASDLIAAETTISDLELEQTKAETDLEPVRERLSRNQVRIWAATSLRSAGQILSGMLRNTSTTSGSNWRPDQREISSRAAESGNAAR